MLCTQTIKPAAALTRAPPTHPLELPHPTPSSSYSDAPPLQTQRHNTNSPVQCMPSHEYLKKKKAIFFQEEARSDKCEPEMQKVADAADISVLFFAAGANFWAIWGHFWAILAILGHFWVNLGNFGSFLACFTQKLAPTGRHGRHLFATLPEAFSH